MTESQVETDAATTSRRVMITGMGAVGASVLLAACGTGDGDGSLAEGGGATTTGGNPGATTGAPEATDEATRDAGTSTKLAATSGIPVEGGMVFADRQVVVTQPAKGEFRCFTAVCTHQQCTVANVRDGTINCGCHGSQFSIADGSVKRGPAAKALDSVTIKVDGDAIFLDA